MLTNEPRQLLELCQEQRTRLYQHARAVQLADLATPSVRFLHLRRRLGRALVAVGLWLQRERVPSRRSVRTA